MGPTCSALHETVLQLQEARDVSGPQRRRHVVAKLVTLYVPGTALGVMAIALAVTSSKPRATVHHGCTQSFASGIVSLPVACRFSRK